MPEKKLQTKMYNINCHNLWASAKIVTVLLDLKSSKTTYIYTHVSVHQIGKIASPLDNLEMKKSKIAYIHFEIEEYMLYLFSK